MADDQYMTVSAQIPLKTAMKLDKLAMEYRLSRANTILRLLEKGIMDHGEVIEVSSVSPDGLRRKDGIPVSVNNGLRNML